MNPGLFAFGGIARCDVVEKQAALLHERFSITQVSGVDVDVRRPVSLTAPLSSLMRSCLDPVEMVWTLYLKGRANRRVVGRT
jgi:hypothetical protein